MQGYYPNNNNYNYANSVMTVFVNGRQGAESYPVAAGYTVMLIDFNAKQFWIKGTDVNGVPQRMREFNFDEVIQQPTNQNPDMVTRSEFDSLNNSETVTIRNTSTQPIEMRNASVDISRPDLAMTY